MSGIENADAGHVEDEVAARLADADQAAHRAVDEDSAHALGALNFGKDSSHHHGHSKTPRRSPSM